LKPDPPRTAHARHGTVAWIWTPAPLGYRPRVWSRLPPHCGAQVPYPTGGWTPAQAEWWVNALSALPFELQGRLFDEALAGARRVWLWIAQQSPEAAPVYGAALAHLCAEVQRLVKSDDERLQSGRLRALWRRYVAAGEARVRKRGTFARGNRWGQRFAREAARLLEHPEARERLLARARPLKEDFRAAVAHAHWSLTPRQRGRFAGFLWAACYGWRVLGPEWERRFDAPPPPLLAQLGERCTGAVA
jgi:hypothetical protein